MRTMANTLITCLISAATLSVLWAEPACADANADAFNDGKTFGTNQNNTIKPTITPANGSANVPGYSATSGESAYFNNGNGVLTPAANSDVTNCNTNMTDPNPAAHGHCEGVRMMTLHPNAKASIFPLDKATDPLVVQGKAVTSNPTLYTGSNPSTAYSGCVSKNVTSGAIYSEEHCSEYLAVEDRQCTETLNVTVSKHDSCVPGTWFASGQVGRDGGGIPNDQVYAQARCDMTTPGQKQTFQIYAHGGQGACVGWQQLQIDPLVATTAPVAAPGLSPHWNGYCNALSSTYTHNGCPGGNCSTTFRFYTTSSSCPGGGFGGIGGLGGGFGGASCAQYCTNGGSPSCTVFGSCSCPFGGSISTAPVVTESTRAVITLNYEKPHGIVDFTDTWDDQCATYKARLP